MSWTTTRIVLALVAVMGIVGGYLVARGAAETKALPYKRCIEALELHQDNLLHCQDAASEGAAVLDSCRQSFVWCREMLGAEAPPTSSSRNLPDVVQGDVKIVGNVMLPDEHEQRGITFPSQAQQ